jgi:hypothetical protein
VKVLLTIATVILLTAGLSAQPKKVNPQQVQKLAGTWRMTCDTCSSPLVLELAIDGTCILGKLDSRAVMGHIAQDGSVVFALPQSWQAYKEQSLGANDAKEMYSAVNFVTLRQDGTLEGHSDVFIRGYGSTAIKRLEWTARRVVVR